MGWQFVYRGVNTQENVVDIPILFSQPRLMIGAKSDSPFYLGKLFQIPFVDGFGFVRGIDLTVQSGYQIAVFSNEFPYRLGFEIGNRVQSIELSFWVETMPFYNQQGGAATQGIPRTVNAAIAVTKLLDTNTLRKGSIIFYNNSVAALYIGFSDSVTTANAPIAISGGATYELPTNYLGEIWGIWSMASGKVIITEFQ